MPILDKKKSLKSRTLTFTTRNQKKKDQKKKVEFKVSRIKEIIKIRTECNDMRVHTHRNVMKPKVSSLKRLTEFRNLKLDCR